MNKTNALRILEKNKISFSVREYDVDENDLSGLTVAVKISADPDTVFKTIVAYGDKTGHLVFCIPTNHELNLKKAASITSNKNVELIKVKDLFSLTGYIRGGCSPIGMKKIFPTYIDETAQLYEQIFISAGTRGMQVLINPDDLVRITNGIYTDLL